MRKRFVLPVVALMLVLLAVAWLVLGRSPSGQPPANQGGAGQAIREIMSMKEIVSSIDETTLLVLDVDNTVIEPEGNLGSDQWWYFLVAKYQQIDKMEEKKAHREAMDLWNKTQWLITVRAVETLTPGIIKQQQQRGVKVMGFTARTPDIAEKTLEQLQSIGVDYSNHPIHAKDFKFQLDGGSARYTKGVLFIGEGNDKGKALVQFLKTIAFNAKRIVFVDDKEKNVESVAAALKANGTEYLCFKYDATYPKVRQFEADTRDIRLFCYGEWTPEAKAALKKAKQK
ncbi:MAG: DUF2608 domain-containing protein [Gemmataceae bacterium]|nr:DUF2608 domain-containing protein [Gemmataceae bacterium]